MSRSDNSSPAPDGATLTENGRVEAPSFDLVRHSTISAAVGKACKGIYEIQAYGDIVAARKLFEQASAMLAKVALTEGEADALSRVFGDPTGGQR